MTRIALIAAIGAGLGLGLGTGTGIASRKAAASKMAADSAAALVDSLALAGDSLGVLVEGESQDTLAIDVDTGAEVMLPAAAPTATSATANAAPAAGAGDVVAHHVPVAAGDSSQLRLSRIVAAMEPGDAAGLIGALKQDASVQMLAGMSERKAAAILAHLPAELAAELMSAMIDRRR